MLSKNKINHRCSLPFSLRPSGTKQECQRRVDTDEEAPSLLNISSTLHYYVLVGGVVAVGEESGFGLQVTRYKEGVREDPGGLPLEGHGLRLNESMCATLFLE